MANRCLSRHRVGDGEPVTTRRVRLLLRATKPEPATSLREIIVETLSVSLY
jgi:hypothetical protein